MGCKIRGVEVGIEAVGLWESVGLFGLGFIDGGVEDFIKGTVHLFIV
jgi:hypothetical protein